MDCNLFSTILYSLLVFWSKIVNKSILLDDGITLLPWHGSIYLFFFVLLCGFHKKWPFWSRTFPPPCLSKLCTGGRSYFLCKSCFRFDFLVPLETFWTTTKLDGFGYVIKCLFFFFFLVDSASQNDGDIGCSATKCFLLNLWQGWNAAVLISVNIQLSLQLIAFPLITFLSNSMQFASIKYFSWSLSMGLLKGANGVTCLIYLLKQVDSSYNTDEINLENDWRNDWFTWG